MHTKNILSSVLASERTEAGKDVKDMTGELWEVGGDAVWFTGLHVGLLREKDFGSEEYEITPILLPRVFILPSIFSFSLLFLLAQLIAYDMKMFLRCGWKPWFSYFKF